MKNSRNITFVSIVAVGIAAALILRAQETAMPVQDGAISLTDTNVDWNSMSDLEVELKAIESVPAIPADSLPQAGTFWSAQHAPGSPDAWPPLPSSFGMGAWSLGDDGVFLLDDLTKNYDAPVRSSLITRGGMSAMNLSLDDDSGGSFSPMFSPADYSTNLWLQITNLSSGAAGILISNTEADIQYEIQVTTNLSNPQWTSEGFVYGSEITNWTPASAAATTYPNLFFRIRSWIDSDNVGIPDWWQLQYFGTIGIDPYAASPAGDGFDIFSKYQSGLAPTTFVTPPAPNNFIAVLSTNGTNVLLSWDAAQGTVTNYAIVRGVFDFDTFEYDYTPLGTVSGGATSFTDVGAVSGGDEGDFVYQLTADYAGGNTSGTANSGVYDSQPPPPTPPTPTYNINVSATLIRNATGRWQLMFSALPANAQAIQLIWGNGATTNILASSLTNGIYLIPDTVSVNHLGDTISVQGMQTNGEAGTVSQAGVLANDAPYFVDGRAHLKQNLIFLLMGATQYYPYMVDPYFFESTDYRFNSSTNLEESSFIHRDSQYSGGDGSTWIALDNLWPFSVNYDLRNDVFDTNNPGPFSFNWQTNFNPNPAPPVLTNAEPYWIAQSADSNRLADLGVSLFSTAPNSFGVTTNFVSLQGGTFFNCYGLLAESGEGVNNRNVIDPRTGLPYGGPLVYQAIGLGDTVNWIITPLGNYWSQFQTPVLTNAGYYFAPLANPNINSMNLPSVDAQPIPLPLDDNFAVTNQTPLIIGAVGQPMIIGGWAKYGIQNGASGKYAYLGQYFVTNTFLLNTNGVVTTNSAGILSPYGEFFPTHAGQAQLITMPDIDTGKQGTNIVQIISLNVDANHDGTMDLSYFGQDQTSPSKPYVFWANNNFDRAHSVDFNTDSEQDDLEVDYGYNNGLSYPMPDCNYTRGGSRVIPCARDLEDFSRLWINGVTSNLLATLPSGSTVTLNWGDVGSPNSSNPTIDLFMAADTDGGTGYLTNSTIAAEQTNITQCPYLDRLGPGQSIQLNTSDFANNWAGNYFIWCGVTNGSGQLSLTFRDRNGNVLGQASVYIQIVDTKQMYERWTVGDESSAAPATTAYPAGDLPTDMTQSFQYTTLATTNTPYILFVHGWNMPIWEKDRYAETSFKRLYWQGYQGRFGEFRWPTLSGFPLEEFSAQAFSPRNFDDSESNAWASAAGLLNKLTDLNAQYPNKVYLIAHSMGNVVAGEALRLAGSSRVVNTYVAMQAAVSAHAYDTNTPTRDFSASTPDDYAHYWTNGAPCYFNSSAGAGTYVNFYNTNDWALAGLWPIDQNAKPDNSITGYPGYHYSVSSLHTNGFYVQFGSGTNDFQNFNFPDDTYVIFSFCDEARSYALGAQANVNGKFAGNQVNLRADPYDFSDAHKYHSGEFRSDNTRRWQFWNTVLVQMGLEN